jgi:hypothetical protein
MLCLFTAAGVLAASLAADALTLAWTHSVEKVAWEEDWRLAGGRLELVEARIQGSGAGMEPPPDAVLAGGWWRYRPALPPQERLVLARSGAVEEYRLCVRDACRPLDQLAPVDAPSVTVLAACR